MEPGGAWIRIARLVPGAANAAFEGTDGAVLLWSHDAKRSSRAAAATRLRRDFSLGPLKRPVPDLSLYCLPLGSDDTSKN